MSSDNAVVLGTESVAFYADFFAVGAFDRAFASRFPCLTVRQSSGIIGTKVKCRIARILKVGPQNTIYFGKTDLRRWILRNRISVKHHVEFVSDRNHCARSAGRRTERSLPLLSK